MFHRIRTRYRAWRDRRRARAAYWRHHYRAAGLAVSLADVGDHEARHHILARYSTQVTAMRNLVRCAFGPDLDEDGRAPWQVLADEAICLRLLSDVELVLAHPRLLGSRRDTTTHLERAAGPVLDRAVAAGRLDHAVLVEMADAVEPIVGAEVAETLLHLRFPAARSDFHVAG